MTSTDREKGSVAVFLALILCAFLTFVFVLLESARIHAAGTVLWRASESAMDSVLSQYQRELFERYGLLFLDGSYGSGISDPAFLQEEYAMWFEKNRGGAFVSLSLSDVSLVRTVTAADYSGEIFRDSALRFQRIKMEEGARGTEDFTELSRKTETVLNVLRMGDRYLSAQEDPGNTLPEGGEDTEAFRLLQAVGTEKCRPFSYRILPAGTVLSGTALPLEGRPSLEQRDARHLTGAEHFSGTGDLTDAEEKQLFISYLLDFFPSLPDPRS